MKNLILDVETILINLFQVGISSTTDSFIEEISEISDKCTKYNLILISKVLNELYLLLKIDKTNKTDISAKIMLLTNYINILKQKITYDKLGGY